MKQRSNWSPFVTCVLTGAALSGCGGNADDPCPGVVKGASYEVRVVEAAQTAQPEGCNAEWGIADGTLLVATADRLVPSATCAVATPELSGADDWSFERRDTEPKSDGFMRATYDATFRECEATVSLSLDAGTGLPCFQAGGDGPADCELILNINASGGQGCPERCSARLVTTVTQQ